MTASEMDASDTKTRQMIEDARAMVRESWANYSDLIKTVEVGYKCGLAPELSANIAIQNIQITMVNEWVRAGLGFFNDKTMSSEEFVQRGVQAGKDAAADGACTRMTPAERGRLRSLIGTFEAWRP